MSTRKKRLVSGIDGNKKTAKQFHKMDYLVATDSYLDNYAEIQDEKRYRLGTPNLQVVDEIIDKWKHQDSEIPIYDVIDKIYQKNKNFSFIELDPPKHDNIMSLIANKDTLLTAYRAIRKNKGFMTEASTPPKEELVNLNELELQMVTNTSSNGITMSYFDNMHEILKTGKWPWGYSKRIWIEKPGQKSKLRPITIPPWGDKVVQEAIAMVLNAIYEPWFYKQDVSIGFRPNRSCHNAMALISTRANTQGMTWALEGDIKCAYDNVDKDILIGILSKRIKDKKFLRFMKERLKLKLFDTENKEYEKTLLGIPQGGIDSPYLYNIYMKEFDDFILSKIDNEVK